MFAQSSFTPRFATFGRPVLGGVLLANALAMAVVFSTPALAQPAPVTFKDTVFFDLRENPSGLSLGDIDGDGDLDVVVANNTQGGCPTGECGRVTVYKNTGDWDPPSDGFSERMDYPLESIFNAPYDVQLADMDADGDLDIVVTIQDWSKVFILENDGTGCYWDSATDCQEGGGTTNFLVPAIPTDSDTIFSLSVADINGDGVKDISIAGSDVNLKPQAEVLWGRETEGVFDWDVNQPILVPNFVNLDRGKGIVTGSFQYPQVAGRLDMAMTLEGTQFPYTEKLVIFRYDDDDAFPPIWDVYMVDGMRGAGLATGVFRTGVEPAVLDLVSTHRHLLLQPNDEHTVHIFENQPNQPSELFIMQEPGEHALDVYVPRDLGRGPYGVATGLLNGDARVDLAVVCPESDFSPRAGTLAIFLAHGKAGDFYEPPTFVDVYDETRIGVGSKPCFVKIGDLDQDGHNDVVVTNWDGDYLAVAINDAP
ncbi:MAG: VCBS repeat-containing protein [Planctomycetes bacterium]|nr:VCBS repeat-containing protein [Planctomycetota bacterium]